MLCSFKSTLSLVCVAMAVVSLAQMKQQLYVLNMPVTEECLGFGNLKLEAFCKVLNFRLNSSHSFSNLTLFS